LRRVAWPVDEGVQVEEHPDARVAPLQLARGRGDTGLGATVHRGAVAFLQRDDRSVGGEEIELRRCEIAVPFPEMHVERHAVPAEVDRRRRFRGDDPDR